MSAPAAAHVPSPSRYERMAYRRCGRSGLQLSAVSLGLWHNFGAGDDAAKARDILLAAFDLGITHFDLANNYGPPPGAAEQRFGEVLERDLRPHRDEILIATKAGYTMWPGPYGDWGSRKSLVASLDQSLTRMKLEYVDIYYHHRPDPNTPLEETMAALDHVVRAGKALYAGLSRYPAGLAREAQAMLRSMGTPCVIHQHRYNLFDRAAAADGLLDALPALGMGGIAFSPLAQGLLTDRYLRGVPDDSRAAGGVGFLGPEHLTPDRLRQAAALDRIARDRGQTLAQMAIAWVLREPAMCSVLIGASRVSQVTEAVQSLDRLAFGDDELAAIEETLS